jgi:hypothetical protein
VDRAIDGPPPTARRATLIILALGLVAVAWAGIARLNSREHRAGKIEIDADSAQVVAAIGAPSARCGDASLEHLRGAFPPGTPATLQDDQIVALREQTARRWVYSGDDDKHCDPARGDTEVGWDARGHVLWYVASLGRTQLVMPDSGLADPQP